MMCWTSNQSWMIWKEPWEYLFHNKNGVRKRLEKTLVSFSFACLKAIEGSVTAGFPQKNIANKNNRNPFFDKNSGFIF